ncbi:MAG: hypothetical protein AB7P40_15755 [Chloroflexota bacterium]
MRQYTADRAIIQQWVEERGGQPARVRGTAVPRFAFEALPPNWEPVGWPEFFELLERGRLGLMYEDTPGSRVCKLVKASTI